MTEFEMIEEPRGGTSVLLCAVILLLSLTAGTAGATPLIVNAGETAIFNFDLSSASPSPPYTQLDVSTGASDLLGLPTGTWTAHDAADAAGAVQALGSDLTALSFSDFSSASTFLDGVFSISLSVDAGSITVDPSVTAWGDPPIIFVDPGLNDFNCAGTPSPCDPIPVANITFATPSSVLVASVVPEPATLASMGLALVAFGFQRRLRRDKGR